MPATAKCLCGTVQVMIGAASKSVGACHCRMCRRWGGGPLLAVDGGTDVSISGEENVGVFNSSPWAERGFCTCCGTHLFYRIKQTRQYMIPAGLLDDPVELVFEHQVFVDERPDYYCFANETHEMTGAEVFAKFAPKS
jgi:hypothetical protein